ncbi:hypothetical protein BDV27DRAFT_132582, partial [Aspergillus caelatus]
MSCRKNRYDWIYRHNLVTSHPTAQITTQRRNKPPHQGSLILKPNPGVKPKPSYPTGLGCAPTSTTLAPIFSDDMPTIPGTS